MGKCSPQRGEQAVAVVGMACRVPDADNYNAFWNNLHAGRNSVKEITPRRRELSGRTSGTHAPKHCAAIEGIELFDHEFFDLSRREAEGMDPQQRLVLEEAYHCIEDAAVSMDTLRRRVTSVFLGVSGSDYSLLAFDRGDDTDSHAALGNLECFAANRISHQFGFRGISLSLDAATASSLVAVHEAKKSLYLRESDFALAAAVNLTFHPWRYIAFEKAGMLSSDGQCKSFDINANGFVYGEGVVFLLLQRLDDALRDANHIYGIIRGSAVNHSGRVHTITAPSVSAQREAVLAAWEEAGLDLETAGYIEAHGTGTSVGDPIEIEALTQAFARHTSRHGFCKIGSVKSNIGHLFSAAGLAGLIKVLLMMRHQKVPKTLNIKQLNPLIDFTASPFLPALEGTEWQPAKDELPRSAGINAIGLGGVNVHVVLEEYRVKSAVSASTDLEASNLSLPFILSAKSPRALQALLDRWIAFAASEDFDKIPFNDLCLTLATGREYLPHRLGLCLSNKSDVARKIGRLGSESAMTTACAWNMHLCGLTPSAAASLLRAGLRHDLFRRYYYEITKTVAEVDSGILMWEKEPESEPNAVFAFVVEYVCARFLMALGMVPRQLSGSGTGLWTALAVCGILSPRDAAALLSNQRHWHEVELHRPDSIPFYDSVGRTLIMPSRFSAKYFTELVADVRVPPDVLSELQGKARLLADSQSTFKRHMAQWRQALRPAGLDLDALLKSWSPRQREADFASHESLLALMIASTLCKLGRPWNLKDPLPRRENAFREMVELLADDLLSPIDVVGLFTRGSDEATRVAEKVTAKQADKMPTRSYARLNQHSRLIDEVVDPGNWLQLALAQTDIPSAAPGTVQLEFGDQVWLRIEGEQVEVFEMVQSAIGAGFIPLLVGLWCHGVDLAWWKLYPEGSFSKVSLPGYPFQRQAHWLTPLTADDRETDTEPVKACLFSPKEPDVLNASEAKTKVARYLRELLSKELGIPCSGLAENKPFSELGVTSIMVAAMVKRIEAWLNDKLDPSVILDYPTISRLSAYLAEYHTSFASKRNHAAHDQQAAATENCISEMLSSENANIAGAELTEVKEISGKVAVIGVACHFPEATDKNQFWNNLAAGRSSIVEVPELRWDLFRHYSATREKQKSISKWGGFIQGIDYFDPEYFGLKADVAPHVDPLIRQFLESAVQCFADAGYDKPELAGKRLGVYVGSRMGNYRNRIGLLQPDTVLGIDQNFIASHVSHLFDLRGPNIVLDSACSSSLMAIHIACQSLMTGECEMALAGGVDILLD
ncbi:MAG: beta-ketoacyl synthase N-terminal-like domain-containing protein, partial [Candidatus Thiodiazotropha sp.]